jgi:hypothetical protein
MYNIYWIVLLTFFQIIYNGECIELAFPFSTIGYTEQVRIYLNTANDPLPFTSRGIVELAIVRTLETIFNQTPIPWKLVPRNELGNFEPPGYSKTFLRCLNINQKAEDFTFKPLAGEIDESYSLTVGEDGEAVIDAVSSNGVLHALQTFTQVRRDLDSHAT